MPHPRATSLFARTVYRELRRANYDRASLVRFLADLAEIISTNVNSPSSDVDGDVAGVVDPETGLPNQSAFDEVLDFEMNRAARTPGAQLLLVAIDLAIPEWIGDADEHDVHRQAAIVIRQSLRNDDSVFRLKPRQYLLILPNASPSVAPVLYSRLGNVLHRRQRAGDQRTDLSEIRFQARAAAWTADVTSREAFVSTCLSAPPSFLHERFPSEPATGQRVRAASITPAPSVVLALGGGAGRAAAHIGVIRALTNAGVEIHGIAGTSAGALVGAMLLGGQTAEDALERFSSFAGTLLYREMRKRYAEFLRRSRRARPVERYFRRSGLSALSDLDTAAISDDLYQELIEYFVGRNQDISSLSKPLATCATDLVTGRSVVFTHGPLHAALRASCAVPGLFAPQVDGARVLADGAIVSDVPTQAALTLELGSPLLGVYLGRPEQRVRTFHSAAEVQVRAMAITHTELVREQLRRCPLILTAEVGEVGWLDFKRAKRTAELGEASALEAIPRILEEMGRLGRERRAT